MLKEKKRKTPKICINSHWEAKAGRLLEVRSLRPACGKTPFLLKTHKLAGHGGACL